MSYRIFCHCTSPPAPPLVDAVEHLRHIPHCIWSSCSKGPICSQLGMAAFRSSSTLSKASISHHRLQKLSPCDGSPESHQHILRCTREAPTFRPRNLGRT